MQLKRNKGMEFETLKKSHKKQIIIGALAVCVIGGALTFNLTRAKYKVDGEVDLVRGTVNYTVPDMRVVAVKLSEDGANYTDVSDVPASGYILNTTNSMCKIATTDAKENNITIEYKDGKVNFLGVGNKNTRCYLYFDKYVPVTIDNIIAGLGAKSTTPNFAYTARTDEGVYAVSDGMYGGTSYYWRGAATTNYVKFANFCWRIVRINGDKTMRLIYDGTTCHTNGTSTAESIAVISQTYNPLYNRSESVGWTYSIGSQRTTDGTASNAKSQTESWYNSNIIGTNAQKVADGKFCNDRNTASGSAWSSQPTSTFYYAAYGRLDSAKRPTLSCPSSDVYTLKVGAITADEAAFAGGVYGYSSANNAYYLYNGHNYWTMTPYDWSYNSSSEYWAGVLRVTQYGELNANYINNVADTSGLRPVINLKADTIFASGGVGTQSNPYVVE